MWIASASKARREAARPASGLHRAHCACILVLLFAFLVGCHGSSGPESRVLYVDSRASALTASGSEDNPFPTITIAVEQAAPGDIILIRPGRYEEALLISKAPLTLRRDPASRGDHRVVIAPPVGQEGIAIIDPGGGVPETTALVSLDVSDPSGVGIRVEGASVRIEDCRVRGSRMVRSEDPRTARVGGIGILALSGSAVTVVRGEVSGCEGPGILAVESSLTLDQTSVLENGAEGIRLERCMSASLTDVAAARNHRAGLAVLSSNAKVVRGVFSETGRVTDRSGQWNYGDGIVVATLEGDDSQNAISEIELEGAAVNGNERIGILMATGAIGTIRDSTIERNRLGGVWLQGNACEGAQDRGCLVANNVFTGNTLVSVNVTVGARATLQGNHLENTNLLEYIDDSGESNRIAYAVSVLSGAWASVLDNRFAGFSDAGSEKTADILVQGAAAGTGLAGNSMDSRTGAPLKIVLQHQENSLGTPDEIVAANPGATVETIASDKPISYPVPPFMTDVKVISVQ